MQYWDALEKRMKDVLRLKVPPVAVKLLRKIDGFEEAREPKKPYTFCQLTAFARIDEEIVVGTRDNIICAYATANLGFEDFPDEFLSGKMPWATQTRNGKNAIKFVRGLAKIETGKFQAVVLSPLRKTQMEPDVVLVVGNPAQMMVLLNACVWMNGEYIHSRNAGHCGVCSEGVAAPYIHGKPHLAIPCMGGRMWGRYADDEMIMSIPGNMLRNIIPALEEIRGVGMRYPIPQQITIPEKELSVDIRRPKKWDTLYLKRT